MPKGFFNIPTPLNETVLNYGVNTIERTILKNELQRRKSIQVDIPMYINGKEIRTGQKINLHPPHEHQHILGQFHLGNKEHVTLAIDAALQAKKQWNKLPWENRAAVFLKAADLVSGPYRASINAATMLGQSKNAYQAEIDAACEFADFLRYNVQFMTEIYAEQPHSSPQIWNRLEYRALEGFIFALTPFNFTAIAGNLPAAPALMGNTVVWKPAETQIYAAQVIMEIFIEAGLPDGVINLIYVDGPDAGEVIFQHPDFAGLHFTGSTGVFQQLWKTIGHNIHLYKSYPRIVGETGGKDFIIAHTSADVKALATGMVRGAFEYQGQKCSAASRAYIPKSLWAEVKELVLADLATLKMGSVEDFSNFVNAVISEKAFDSIAKYIDYAADSKDAKIIAGGKYDKSVGYFIEPTIIETTNPKFKTMCEEIFGPVLTVYIYKDEEYEQVLQLADATSPYALTGAIFAKDRFAIQQALEILEHSAGNFYINDKPTGAVVGQQPFGGGRGSGTNDKAGAKLNLLRWVSARTIKETFISAKDYRYPFLNAE
jgi:1-pyrroline-5-carboxylate dehydrogenase